MGAAVTNWAEHYKAVRSRIASAKPAVDPKRVGVVTPAAPEGRDWLVISSKDQVTDVGAKPKENIVTASLQPRNFRASRNITCAEIIRIVSFVYDVSIRDIKSPRRARDIAEPRQEAMWLCCLYTAKSLPEIGRNFGGRDHTTVLHARRKISSLVEKGAYEPRAAAIVMAAVRQIEAMFSDGGEG